MKVVILAGGVAARFGEEFDLKPKPMIEIGGKPVLWHIMKIYSSYGFNDFIICLGDKGYIIKEYFHHYFLHHSDFTVDISNNKIESHNSMVEPWKVTLVDTGLNTGTGGRIKRIEKYTGNEPFMMTYGDGVTDLNIKELVDFHEKYGKYATVTGVNPVARCGAIISDEQNNVLSIEEKTQDSLVFINSGFFVLEPQIFDYIENDEIFWEKQPLQNLSKDNHLSIFKHRGFWKPMDTLREKKELENLWSSGKPPWKVW